MADRRAGLRVRTNPERTAYTQGFAAALDSIEQHGSDTTRQALRLITADTAPRATGYGHAHTLASRTTPMSTPAAPNTDRLREIAQQLPHAAYPNPDWDLVHALEDEAATLLGKRTVRQATDVVSGRELYALLQRAIKPTMPPQAVPLPPAIAAIHVPTR
jgi:hypothetical protein